jgi:hypothetical protein
LNDASFCFSFFQKERVLASERAREKQKTSFFQNKIDNTTFFLPLSLIFTYDSVSFLKQKIIIVLCVREVVTNRHIVLALASLRTATLLWAQRSEWLYIRIDLQDVSDEKIDVTAEGKFSFEGKSGDKSYKHELELFKSIDVKVCLHKFFRFAGVSYVESGVN